MRGGGAIRIMEEYYLGNEGYTISSVVAIESKKLSSPSFPAKSGRSHSAAHMTWLSLLSMLYDAGG